jgi:hypothetical protein
MVGGFLVVNAIEERIYNCNRDPYFPEWCQAPGIAYFPILIGPWLVATYLLARREAIVLVACLFMGLMWWLGFLPISSSRSLGSRTSGFWASLLGAGRPQHS